MNNDCDNCPACDTEEDRGAYCNLCRCKDCKCRVRLDEVKRWAEAWRQHYIKLQDDHLRDKTGLAHIYSKDLRTCEHFQAALSGEMEWPEKEKADEEVE